MFVTATICKLIFGLAQNIWTSPKHFGTCKRTRHNIDDQAEHVDELSNQEVPKFGFEDCADVGNVSDEIDFYGDDSKTKVRRTSGLCLILWIGLTSIVLTIF